MPGNVEARSLQLGLGKLAIRDVIPASRWCRFCRQRGEGEKQLQVEVFPSDGAVNLPPERDLSPPTIKAPR